MERNTNGTLQPNISLLDDLNQETSEVLLPVTIVFSLLSLVGVVGNSFVLYVWCVKFKNSISNTCVRLLAFLDLLTCTVGIPFEIYNLYKLYYFESPTTCRILRSVIKFSVTSSVVVLLVLAIIRYYAVLKPLKVFPIKSRRIISLSLGAGLCLSWPVLVLFGTEINPTKYLGIDGVRCGIDKAFANSPFPPIYFSVLGLVFVVSIIVLSGLYVSIGLSIYRRNHGKSSLSHMNCGRKYIVSTTTKGDQPKDGAPSHRRSLSKRNRLFFAITSVFVLSFLPSLTMMAIKAHNRRIETTLPGYLYVGYVFCSKMYLMNSCANPMLYAFMNTEFQKECKTLFMSLKGFFCSTTDLHEQGSRNTDV